MRPIAGLLLGCGAAFQAYAQDVFPPPPTPERLVVHRALDEIVVDGHLNEQSWQQTPPIDGFTQMEPQQGEPGTYGTLVRVVYDDDALYISAVCDQPRATVRVQNLERDFSFDDNDLFGVAIDGILDQRSALAFQVTPRGNQRDLEVIDGSEFNSDWDASWETQTRIEEDRWLVEIAIPWRTLRYRDGADRLGVVFGRNIRHLNEITAYPPVPRVFSIYRMAYQGELVGLRAPSPTANIQIHPYSLADYTDSGDSESDIEFGGEVKWAISPDTVLDITVNTDFAQAEVDRQVVNLDRFSVFFPERRQFFLEVGRNSWSPSDRLSLRSGGQRWKEYPRQATRRSFGLRR